VVYSVSTYILKISDPRPEVYCLTVNLLLTLNYAVQLSSCPLGVAPDFYPLRCWWRVPGTQFIWRRVFPNDRPITFLTWM